MYQTTLRVYASVLLLTTIILFLSHERLFAIVALYASVMLFIQASLVQKLQVTSISKAKIIEWEGKSQDIQTLFTGTFEELKKSPQWNVVVPATDALLTQYVADEWSYYKTRAMCGDVTGVFALFQFAGVDDLHKNTTQLCVVRFRTGSFEVARLPQGLPPKLKNLIDATVSKGVPAEQHIEKTNEMGGPLLLLAILGIPVALFYLIGYLTSR